MGVTINTRPETMLEALDRWKSWGRRLILVHKQTGRSYIVKKFNKQINKVLLESVDSGLTITTIVGNREDDLYRPYWQ